jgi:hypothetical protein
MNAHLIPGATAIGRPFNVSIYARSEEDAQKQFRFRYAPIGCVIVGEAIAESEDPEPEPELEALPVITIRKRSKC